MVMPVPKRQHSKSRTNRRVAGKHKIVVVSGVCNVCQSFTEQHAVCQGCGFYKGMKLMRTKAEREQERKISRRVKERSLQASAAQTKVIAEPSSKEATEKKDKHE
jgi:large subunit ribosomal protein L32